jgi:hypothetical protein
MRVEYRTLIGNTIRVKRYDEFGRILREVSLCATVSFRKGIKTLDLSRFLVFPIEPQPCSKKLIWDRAEFCSVTST